MNTSKKLIRPPDLAASPSGLSFEQSLAAPLREGLSRALAEGGVDVATARLHFAPLKAVGNPSVPTVALYDGLLTASLAAALERPQPVLLCAQSGPASLPRPLDLRLIAALLAGRPLRPSNVQWRRAIVGTLQEAEQIMTQLTQSEGARSAPSSALYTDVAYELIANALLDAPTDEAGKPKYAHRRHESPKIAAEDACGVAVGLAENAVYINVVDRFGRLTAEPLTRTLRGWDSNAKLHTDGGGAGLGLRRILEASDVLSIRVIQGKRTEVFAAVSLSGPRRRAGQPKSVFFWADRRGGAQ